MTITCFCFLVFGDTPTPTWPLLAIAPRYTEPALLVRPGSAQPQEKIQKAESERWGVAQRSVFTNTRYHVGGLKVGVPT